MPNVYWLIAAQRRLTYALSHSYNRSQFQACYEQLCRILARTIPDAAAVIVRDRLHGYRDQSNRHTLFVEAILASYPLSSSPGLSCAGQQGPDSASSDVAASGEPDGVFHVGMADFCQHGVGNPTKSRAYVVKIAEPCELRKELEAWENCRPCGLAHDSILMVLRPGARGRTEQDDPQSIIYEDAHHVIGAGLIRSFEDAALDCSRWGSPTVESLLVIIKCLFERLGSDFYARSYTLAPTERNRCAVWEAVRSGDINWPTAARFLTMDDASATIVKEALDDGRLEDARSVVEGYERSEGVDEQLQKLVNLLRLRKEFKRALDDWKDVLKPEPVTQPDRLRIRREVLGSLGAKVASFMDPMDYLGSIFRHPEHCPIVLWGCAHGDLHGRNLLVTVVDGDASLPALFDYDAMDLDALVGLDFVKLETEVKVRALPLVFPRTEQAFIKAVHDFECLLADCTQLMHDQRDYADKLTRFGPAERLARIVLAIREAAREHLGVRRLRDRQWLEEYYFLLTCYGVRAGRYSTYRRRHLIAAYIAAGVAARLLTRPWYELDSQIRAQQALAQERLAADRLDPADGYLPRLPCEMSHHGRLAFATVWCRKAKAPQQRAFIEAAARILDTLRHEYPHVLEIEEELALQYMELGKREKAEELLRTVQLRYQQLSEEMLCRIGRYWKDEAAKKNEEDREEARSYFAESLSWYQRAYSLRDSYYPGINVATLSLLTGDTVMASRTAQTVLDSLKREISKDEVAWVETTRGEAHLLLACAAAVNGERDQCLSEARESRMEYERVLPKLPARDRESTCRQARLILSMAEAMLSQYSSDNDLRKLKTLVSASPQDPAASEDLTEQAE